MQQSKEVDEAVAAHAQAVDDLAAGRLVPARESARRAVDLLTGARSPTDPDVVNVLLAASQIEQAGGDLHAARALAGRAAAGAESWTLEDPDLASLRFEAELDLATIDQALGNLDGAERRLLDALADARQAPAAERSVLLLTNALGVNCKFAGRLDDAQRHYDDVYDLLRSSPDPDPGDLAGLFHNLAGLAHSRGDAADGILWAQRGIALRAEMGDAARLDLARDLGGLGALQHLAGQIEPARDSYARAHGETVAMLGPDHPEVGVLLANRAALESDAGNTSEALATYERALALLTAALGADHDEVRTIAEHRSMLARTLPDDDA
jgi:tetratricopeptide (TPR) repeat protein